MMIHGGIFHTLQIIRRQFELQQVDRLLLRKLYTSYCPSVGNVDLFLLQAQKFFPYLNCGIASLYVQYVLQRGEVTQGSFAGQSHTFLFLPNERIADITSDQLGGPSVYIGPYISPWSENRLPHT